MSQTGTLGYFGRRPVKPGTIEFAITSANENTLRDIISGKYDMKKLAKEELWKRGIKEEFVVEKYLK